MLPGHNGKHARAAPGIPGSLLQARKRACMGTKLRLIVKDEKHFVCKQVRIQKGESYVLSLLLAYILEHSLKVLLW